MTTQQRYAVFEVPTGDPDATEMRGVCAGNALWCVLQLLGRMTLPQLNALKLTHVSHEQRRRVRERVKAECARTGSASARSDPAGAVDGLLVPETDEDGDPVLEATPLQEPEVKWEPGEEPGS